ncbi:MAG: N4-gp56 family major capsid protein [Desulfurococcaceae archaeon]
MSTVSKITHPEFFPLYYEKKLLEYVKANLVATRFGQRRSLPANSGRTIEFYRANPKPVVTTPITDQPTPPATALPNLTPIQVTVQEYGDSIDLYEFTDMTSFVPLVDYITDILADQAQRSLDTIAMNELCSGTNVLYAGGVSSRSALVGTQKLTKTDIRKAVNLLQRENIPPLEDGYYVCLLHPDKILDLFTDAELIQLANASMSAFEKGFVGQFAGVKFYVSTTLPIVSNGGTPSAPVYQTLVLGKDAYGIVDLDGTTLKMVQTNVDRLGRVKTLGWKAYFAVKRLYEPAIVRIESN